MRHLKSIPWSLIVLAIVAIFMLSSCANPCDTITYHGYEEARIPLTYNFFGGLLHGIIMPFAWFFSIFTPCFEMYASNNVGFWYDTGYLMGVILSLGGGMKAGNFFKNELL